MPVLFHFSFPLPVPVVFHLLRRTLITAAAAVFVALLALSTIFILATNRGTLEIRTVDEDVEVVILRNGKKVKALDTKTFAWQNKGDTCQDSVSLGPTEGTAGRERGGTTSPTMSRS